MPHPANIEHTADDGWKGWSLDPWGTSPWGSVANQAGYTVGSGQVVIRHERSTTKKKRLRQRQRMG